jgi:5-formyltetrahydrofolate cyclo-ligase
MASAESVSSFDQKRLLRQAMNDKRAQLTVADRQQASGRAAERLLALDEVGEIARRVGCVAGFAAVRAEIDPAAALDEVRRRGGRVAYPRVADGQRPRLRFHLAESADLQTGRFGIPEPPASNEEVALGQIDLLIVPGVAFDAEGRRVGFGGGYYDELLRTRPVGTGPARPVVLGLGYDFQIVDVCPTEPHDQVIDGVVTDARVIRGGQAERENGRHGSAGAP